MHKFLLDQRVLKDLDQIPTKDVEKIYPLMLSLERNPKPFGCLKMAGYRDRYRLRQGNYRIVYSIDEQNKIVKVLLIAHRKDAYR